MEDTLASPYSGTHLEAEHKHETIGLSLADRPYRLDTRTLEWIDSSNVTDVRTVIEELTDLKISMVNVVGPEDILKDMLKEECSLSGTLWLKRQQSQTSPATSTHYHRWL